MLLALETATDVCGVVLVNGDGHVLAARSTTTPRAHAARLAPMIAEVLAEAAVTPDDLRTVAVSAGPGSFTGLRIGIGTAAGLALSTGADLVLVPTLDALVLGARNAGIVGEAERALGVLPSRRGEVYVGGDGEPPRALPTTAAAPLQGVWVIGARIAEDAITGYLYPPSAAAVACWALTHGERVPPEAAIPAYVQPFVPLRRAGP